MFCGFQKTINFSRLILPLNSSNVASTACPALEVRNGMLRIGLKTDGTGGYASTLPTFASASGNVSAGSGTVTMSGMSQSGQGGSTFSIVQGALINIADANAETVSVTSVSGNTWTATFTKSHTSPFNFTVQSPYYGTYDYVMDWGTNLETTLGSCTWANYATMTGDGTHLLAGNNGATGGNGHGIAAALLAPIFAANLK